MANGRRPALGYLPSSRKRGEKKKHNRFLPHKSLAPFISSQKRKGSPFSPAKTEGIITIKDKNE
uniref:Uncharacterized protein n=1 Tax=Oryza brachyantha TaxID=4533 RepID=J3LHT0_ORYBR